jgi:hypothetical protein
MERLYASTPFGAVLLEHINSLRDRAEESLYPELAADLRGINRAIWATALGKPEMAVVVAGSEYAACEVVAMLSLEPDVERRRAAPLN